jgi:hypothetical protein
MVSDFYPPFLGGVEVAVRSLSQELIARGHEVAVATLAAPDLPPSETVDAPPQRAHRLFASSAKPSASAFPFPRRSCNTTRMSGRRRRATSTVPSVENPSTSTTSSRSSGRRANTAEGCAPRSASGSRPSRWPTACPGVEIRSDLAARHSLAPFLRVPRPSCFPAWRSPRYSVLAPAHPVGAPGGRPPQIQMQT